jgi:subfamily B ATP-binding cassette protein HlyB/CyaB
MPRGFLKLVSKSLSCEPTPHALTYSFTAEDVLWVMGSFCALNRKPFDAGLLLKQFPPPYSSDSFIHAARALGFRIKRRDGDTAELSKLNLPCLAVLHAPNVVMPVVAMPTVSEVTQPDGEQSSKQTDSNSKQPDISDAGLVNPPRKYQPAIIVQIKDGNVMLFEVGTNTPKTIPQAEFDVRYAGTAFQLALET